MRVLNYQYNLSSCRPEPGWAMSCKFTRVKSSFIYLFEINISGDVGAVEKFYPRYSPILWIHNNIEYDVFCITQFNSAIIDSYFHVLNMANLLREISHYVKIIFNWYEINWLNLHPIKYNGSNEASFGQVPFFSQRAPGKSLATTQKYSDRIWTHTLQTFLPCVAGVDYV